MQVICIVDDCEHLSFAKLRCRKHYAQWRLQNALECSVANCTNSALSRGLCNAHYKRWKATGNVDASRPVLTFRTPASVRFWDSVDKNGPVPEHDPSLGPCWVWTGLRFRRNYGQFWDGKKTVSAHRFVWTLIHGSIPADKVLDHLCHTEDCRLGDECPHRLCVNPAHLTLTSNRVNVLRGASPIAEGHRQTHCKRGHPLSGDNIYDRARKGVRSCKACARMRARRNRRIAIERRATKRK